MAAIYLTLDEKDFSRAMLKLKKDFGEVGFEKYLSNVANRIRKVAYKTAPCPGKNKYSTGVLRSTLKIVSGKHWRDVGFSEYYASWVEEGHAQYVYGRYAGYTTEGQFFLKRAFNRVVPRLKNIKDFAKW